MILLTITTISIFIHCHQDMTKSEIHAVMTGGFATIAGSVLAAYIRCTSSSWMSWSSSSKLILALWPVDFSSVHSCWYSSNPISIIFDVLAFCISIIIITLTRIMNYSKPSIHQTQFLATLHPCERLSRTFGLAYLWGLRACFIGFGVSAPHLISAIMISIDHWSLINPKLLISFGVSASHLCILSSQSQL